MKVGLDWKNSYQALREVTRQLTVSIEFYELVMHKRPIISLRPGFVLVDCVLDVLPYQIWPLRAKRAAAKPGGGGGKGDGRGRGRGKGRGGGRGRGRGKAAKAEEAEEPAAIEDGEAEEVAGLPPEVEEEGASEPEEGAEAEEKDPMESLVEETSNCIRVDSFACICNAFTVSVSLSVHYNSCPCSRPHRLIKQVLWSAFGLLRLCFVYCVFMYASFSCRWVGTWKCPSWAYIHTAVYPLPAMLPILFFLQSFW